MAYEIRWTDNAVEDYLNVISYLLAEWSIPVAIAFEKAAESRDLNSLLSAVNDFEKYLNLYSQRLATEETVSNK